MKRTGPTYETAGALIGAATGLAVGGVASRLGSSYMEWNGGREGIPGPWVSMVTMGLFGLMGMLIGAGIGQRIPRRNTHHSRLEEMDTG